MSDETKKKLAPESLASAARVEVGSEQVAVPEIQKAKEQQTEFHEQADEISSPLEPAQIVTTVAVPSGAQDSSQDQLRQGIETILSEDLTDVYLSMSPQAQAVFKEKGEETAAKIRELVHTAHSNAKKIFQLIAQWLKLIPGVNRFFLEQEAKIKTDKILLL